MKILLIFLSGFVGGFIFRSYLAWPIMKLLMQIYGIFWGYQMAIKGIVPGSSQWREMAKKKFNLNEDQINEILEQITNHN